MYVAQFFVTLFKLRVHSEKFDMSERWGTSWVKKLTQDLNKCGESFPNEKIL